MYYFDHRSPLTPDGATQGAELRYVFGNFDPRMPPPSAADLALADKISSYWVNFARTGDPNSGGLPSWPAFDETTQQVLYMDGTLTPKPTPNQQQLQALNDYYAWRRTEAHKR